MYYATTTQKTTITRKPQKVFLKNRKLLRNSTKKFAILNLFFSNLRNFNKKKLGFGYKFYGVLTYETCIIYLT